MPLKTNILDVTSGTNKILPAPQVPWHVFDFQVGEKVIFIRNVPDCPEEAGGNRLRLGLNPKLGSPFFARRVTDIELCRQVRSKDYEI